jgi:hypothetical protein
MRRLIVGMGALAVLASVGLLSAYASAQAAPAPAAAAGSDDDARLVPEARFTAVASESVAGMRGSMQRGLEELHRAREKKDAVQLTCVNEHVTAMKGVLKVAENAGVELEEAVATSQTARARYEFRKVQASKKRMDKLLGAALNCAGADSTFSTTAVTVEVDDAVLQFDPYYGDADFFFDAQDDLSSGRTARLGEPDQLSRRPPPASGVL